MAEETGKKICPECKGKKVIAGACECNMEWRGTEVNGEWNDCQCNEEEGCPICHGEGYVTD